MRSHRLNPLAAYVILYVALYGSFGISSPFWPKFFESRGLTPQQIGLVLSLGMLTRLFAGPIAGHVADLSGSLRAVLALCSVFAAVGAVALLSVDIFLTLALLNVLLSAALAPTTSIADALAIRGSNSRGFEYGWVRGSASAAFVAGTLLAGQLLTSLPISSLVWINALLLLGSAAATPLLPEQDVATLDEAGASSSPCGGLLDLLRVPVYRWVVVIAALIYGSHAIHDAFAVIRWGDAGISPIVISILWSEAVVAEVAVFFLLGPRLINTIGANAAAALSAGFGILRWLVEGATTSVVGLAMVQPLHGFTFALLHLVCMRIIGDVIPPKSAATAQSFYALGAGLSTTLLTLLGGVLFARFGGASFIAMVALCVLALPLAWLKIRE
jgi:PPP family 3-phenylpropionic acid transporter